MRFPRLAFLLAALACVLPGVVLAALKASEARVSFLCSGPGGLHIEGTGSQLLAEEKDEALVLSVPLDTVTTGIDLRDTHMHQKYLETAKYPTAALSVPRASLKFPADGESVEATAPGTLSIHGTSRPVTFHYRAVKKGAAYDVSGDVHLNMNDFGIATPGYLGITVKPPVDVSVVFRLLES
jgi:polyisoprenoid-binding protein YceI